MRTISRTFSPALPSACLPDASPIRSARAVKNFKAVEHRLEFVAKIGGVDYYNDSKATNVDATIKALESFPANIHLILGGKDKGSDYSVLNDLLRARVKRVYTIGAAATKIESQIQGAAEIDHAETLENAIRRLRRQPSPATLFFLPPLAPASTSSRTTSTAAVLSKKSCTRYRWPDPRKGQPPSAVQASQARHFAASRTNSVITRCKSTVETTPYPRVSVVK